MIHKGLIDENTYKYEILPNGLKVLFVSNPQLDKSACSISIQTGSNDDTFPGIAHFLEHMLFMGTEKYSRENEWDEFLNLHHGSTNATTDLGVTTYFFDISPDHFGDALDRFCEFFVSPLFNANSVEREIEAVDSEFKNGLLNDCQRLYRMTNIMSTSKYNKFSCGNRNTLSIPNIREKVIQFWKNNYTSDEMCLVIYHNEDIEKDVKERFTRIPKINKNKRIERVGVTFEKHVFDDKNMNRLIYVNTISDIKQLNIFVEVPKHMHIFRDNSYGYLDFLLNKKGVDSLNYKLCQQKYAFDMNANVENYMDFSFVVLEIGLTDLGFADCDAVINTIKLHFEDMFGSESNYKEYRKYMKRTFDYMEQDLPIDFVYNLSNDMQYFPIRNVLDHDAICEKCNEDEIKMIVNILKDSLNWLVFVQGKDVATKECLKEEFYGIEYSVNDQTLKGMPKFMELNIDDGKLLYLYEDKYKIPESYATILLNTEITKENYLARLLYIKMCENEYIRLHDEFLVFNRISINTKLTPDGFMVHFDGFNDYLIKAIKLFFEVFLVLPTNNFELTKESIKQNLSCEMNQSPYRLLTKKFSSLIYKNIPETKSLVNQLEKITYSDVNTNTHKYFIEMVVSGTGNFYGFKDLFLDTTKKMQKWSKNNNVISVTENTISSFTTQDTVNNACGVYLYGGKNRDKKAVAILSLIVQIGNEMFYDELRTKEAFGYVVSNRMLSIHEDNYGAYIVQSERGNDVIEKRVHQFIADLQVLIDNMDDDELETHKESVVSDYSEQFKNLKEFHAFYLELYFSDSFDLTYREDVIEAVRAVTKDELKVSAMSAAVILANKNEN